MTNKEWLATLPTNECYEIMHWLFHVYSFNMNNSKKAVTDWLDSTESGWRTLIAKRRKENENND